MDVLRSMAVFCRVVEGGSFTAIANEMNASQSSISKHIAALEQRLSTKLLNRTTRQLKLTESGELYYQHCLRILADLAESEASVNHDQSLTSGMLRITAPVSFGRLFIAPLLWEFLNRYPEIKIEFIMNDEYIDLIKEGVDVAIRVGELADSNLIARKIGELPELALLASPGYLARQGEPRSLSDLKHHDCLLHSLQTSVDRWEFIGPRGKESVRVNSRFTSNNRDCINSAALAGMGVALTYLWPNAANIKKGNLNVVLADYRPLPMEVYAIYPERNYVPQKVKCLIDYLSTCFESSAQFRSKIENIVE